MHFKDFLSILWDIFILFQAEVITKVEVKTIENAFVAVKELIKLGCKTAIISLGSQGAVFTTNLENIPVHVKVNPVLNPVDTTVSK